MENSKQSLKGKKFIFQGILDGTIKEPQIKALLPDFIVKQQRQFNDVIKTINDIKINKYTYVRSMPDNWIVAAEWEVK